MNPFAAFLRIFFFFKYLFTAIQFDPVAIECDAMKQFLVTIKQLKDPKKQLEYIKRTYSWDFDEDDEIDLKSEDEDEELLQSEECSDEHRPVEQPPQKKRRRLGPLEE